MGVWNIELPPMKVPEKNANNEQAIMFPICKIQNWLKYCGLTNWANIVESVRRRWKLKSVILNYLDDHQRCLTVNCEVLGQPEKETHARTDYGRRK